MTSTGGSFAKRSQSTTTRKLGKAGSPDARRLRALLAAMLEAVGYAPREADLAVLAELSHGARSDAGVAEVVAEYVWDHLLGEPARPTTRQLARTFAAAGTLHQLGVHIWVHDRLYGLVADKGAPHGYRLVGSGKTLVELAARVHRASRREAADCEDRVTAR